MSQLSDRLKEDGNIRIKSKHLVLDNSDGWKHDKWEVTITNLGNGKSLTTSYMTGMGLRKHGELTKPELADVLHSLISDATSYQNANDFDDWCASMGFDSDSRKAENTWNACTKIHKDLVKLLGSELIEELAELEH